MKKISVLLIALLAAAGIVACQQKQESKPAQSAAPAQPEAAPAAAPAGEATAPAGQAAPAAPSAAPDEKK
jgi:hypothetical protein